MWNRSFVKRKKQRITDRVVVLGHSYLARLSIIRALGNYGYDITVLIVARDKHNVMIDCRSKYVNRMLVCPTFDGQTLVKMLLERCADKDAKTILIPTSDVTISMIDEHLDELKDDFLFPHINHEQGLIVHWMDKSVQKELACKLGMNIADSWQVDIYNQKFSIPEGIVYPCFVKPQMTICGGKSFKRCNDEAELKRYIHQMGVRREHIQLLIERYLDIDKEYAVVGFSDGEDVYIPAVIFLEQVSQSHFGVARLGKVLPIEQFRSLVEQFKSYVIAIGYVGLFDIDFLECQGKYYFCEMNFRFGGSGDALTKAGINLPNMLAEKLSMGNVQTIPTGINRQATFYNERVCLDDWYYGFLSKQDYRKIKCRADFGFIEDNNDPKPYDSFTQYRILLGIKKAAKWLMGKKNEKSSNVWRV